ncbi:MAG TPA: 3-deoxy-7-phosphoheptulonate synthase [Phycisphaerae bacterium]|nr:3-deoxy-7-phosphoheptulonate synthase [Phycisphaerae bacterium]HRW55835.1 3-deoxy-7-phosphoheptulonate synthase [Phycisphaerae bacterium]
MYLQLSPTARQQDVDQLHALAAERNLSTRLIDRGDHLALVLLTDATPADVADFRRFDVIDAIVLVDKPYRLASRSVQPHDTIVRVGDVAIGGREPVVIAGPCSVENADMMSTTAQRLAEIGADLLRGGAFKPRTSPYSFQGLGREGLDILSRAREGSGLGVVTEAVSVEVFDDVERAADVIQIGARNMQNYALLARAGLAKKPILLKRHMSATLDELLLAAEYILAAGNPRVILCERGIRTFDDHSRFTLDINCIPILKQLTHLPVIVDPSHAAGRRDIVIPLAKAALAAGADGLLIEVHPNPETALSDGAQSLTIELFESLMMDIRFSTSDRLFAGVTE